MRLMIGRMVENLAGLAGVGNRDHHVLWLDHAEVTMLSLARVHEERRRAGRGEGGGNLAADVAGFAHAGHHHAPRAVENQAAGTREVLVEARHQRGQRLGLEFDHGAAELLQGGVIVMRCDFGGNRVIC